MLGVEQIIVFFGQVHQNDQQEVVQIQGRETHFVRMTANHI